MTGLKHALTLRSKGQIVGLELVLALKLPLGCLPAWVCMSIRLLKFSSCICGFLCLFLGGQNSCMHYTHY